ncbi:hypothetical protein [Phytohabitans rumicis]|uniref:hypothetical protein n=1 Tax=Phytohabitans rumicis TaxID=1076125 RepID=UPI001564385B|nr:hypothetical protein [Phytohabitans rumicis]
MVLTTLAIGVAGAQPVVASSPDPRDPTGSSASTTVAGGLGSRMGSQRSGPGQAPAGDPQQSSDWHLYHHWTDPSWLDPGQLSGRPTTGTPTPTPEPERSGGYGWPPPPPPLTPPSSGSWFPPTESYPPTTSPTATPTPSLTSTPSTMSPDAETSTPTPAATTGGRQGPKPDQANREPVAANPDDQAPSRELGLGDPVDQPSVSPSPSPTPRPTVTAPTAGTPDEPLAVLPVRANTEPTSAAQHTLVYSGMLGLALAVIGLTMVGLRRRRW